MLVKRLFLLGLVGFSWLFPFQVLAVNSHPYSIICGYDCVFFFSDSGYVNSLTSGSPAFSYWYSLVMSDKKTPKGYSYCACNLKFQYGETASFNYSGEASDGVAYAVGLYLTYRTKLNNSGSCIVTSDNRTSDGSQPPSTPIGSIEFASSYVASRMATAVSSDPNSPYKWKLINHTKGGSIVASKNDFRNYGCEVPPDDNQCPNFIIRGLPAVRVTVTC